MNTPLLRLEDIRIRDPFVLPVEEERCYYLFGTTDSHVWKGKGVGFDCYRSTNLMEWEGPIPAFRPPENFWGTKNFWAPEVHQYQGKFYMFASFTARRKHRGTQILVSDQPAGSYTPLTDKPITPDNWECLDGTLYVDNQQVPWIVFCHEFTQIRNGTICAMPLSDDLQQAAGKPQLLFTATKAPWVKKWHVLFSITDGPWLHTMKNGKLLMLWSSFGALGYTMGIAYSESNTITGPWLHQKEPLWKQDGGHGMIFRSFDGELYVTLHNPNKSPLERPVFKKIKEIEDTLRIV